MENYFYIKMGCHIFVDLINSLETTVVLISASSQCLLYKTRSLDDETVQFFFMPIIVRLHFVGAAVQLPHSAVNACKHVQMHVIPESFFRTWCSTDMLHAC